MKTAALDELAAELLESVSGPPGLRAATEDLRVLRDAVYAGPDEDATRKQHERGKLTVRERLELLFDEGTFTEVETLRRHRANAFGLERRRPHGDGVVTGWGLVHGRTVFAFGHDFRVFGGALGEAHAAYIVMDSRSIGADLSFAWPANEIAVMGAEGAANVIFRKEIANAADPEEIRARKIEEYRRELMHPAYAAERGLVDDVIDPADTRSVLIRSLEMLRHKHADQPERKHGNQPA